MWLPSDFDHLVIAVPDLAESVEQCHNLLGVEAIPGGTHPGLGTANALLGLEVEDERAEGGCDIYLEILGPDPEQDPALAATRLAGITEPTVQRWAIHPADFDGIVDRSAESVSHGNRRSTSARFMT